MTKLITLKISGIKCDNSECDYRDDEVRRDNYPEYVNKPCPKCDSNLLTQDDYDAVVALEGLEAGFDIDIPKALLGDLGEEKSFNVEMDGSGEFALIEREEDEETLA